MKAFNLEEAKAGKPVQTKDGRGARIICYDASGTERPIIVLVDVEGNGIEQTLSYTENGHYNSNSPDSDDRLDLVMKTKPRIGYVNLYKASEDGMLFTVPGSRVFETFEGAESIGKNYPLTYLGTSKVEWEE